MTFDVKRARLGELFATYGAILRELKDRGVVRTENAPAGDYAEYLVAHALDGKLAGNSTRSHDLTTPDGRRIQVKCRVADLSGKNPRTQLSIFRSFDFDEVAIVLLRPDYAVHRGVLVPRALAKKHAQRREHANGWVLHARSSLLDAAATVDITTALRAVSQATIPA
jgi:hypothetical protein